MKSECKIIQDILPLYVEDLACDETKDFVDKHLENCEVCRGLLNDMKQSLEIPVKLGAAPLKKVKKKLTRQKLLVGIVASIAAIAVACVGFWFVFFHDTPIEYTQGFVWVEKSEMYWEHNDTTTIDLIFMSDQRFYRPNSISRIINIDGTETEIKFIYLRETMSTRWFPSIYDNHIVRFGYSKEAMSCQIEIYYMVAPFHDMLTMTDEDFYAQRINGVLVWSGRLE